MGGGSRRGWCGCSLWRRRWRQRWGRGLRGPEQRVVGRGPWPGRRCRCHCYCWSGCRAEQRLIGGCRCCCWCCCGCGCSAKQRVIGRRWLPLLLLLLNCRLLRGCGCGVKGLLRGLCASRLKGIKGPRHYHIRRPSCCRCCRCCYCCMRRCRDRRPVLSWPMGWCMGWCMVWCMGWRMGWRMGWCHRAAHRRSSLARACSRRPTQQVSKGVD